jgi:hypothetical protein
MPERISRDGSVAGDNMTRLVRVNKAAKRLRVGRNVGVGDISEVRRRCGLYEAASEENSVLWDPGNNIVDRVAGARIERFNATQLLLVFL